MSTTFQQLLRSFSDTFYADFNVKRLFGLVVLAWRIRRERDQLAQLDARTLADIGVHPGAAKVEAERGLADLPRTRLESLRD